MTAALPVFERQNTLLLATCLQFKCVHREAFKENWRETAITAQIWTSFFETLKEYINTHYPQEYAAYQIREKAKQAQELLLPGFTTAFPHEKKWQKVSTALNKLEKIQCHQNNNVSRSSQEISYTLTFQEDGETQEFSKKDALVYSGLQELLAYDNPKMLAQRAFFADRFLNFFHSQAQPHNVTLAQTAWALFGFTLSHDAISPFFSELKQFMSETDNPSDALFYNRFKPNLKMKLSTFADAWEKTAKQIPLITSYFQDLVACVKTHYPDTYENIKQEEMRKYGPKKSRKNSDSDSGKASSSEDISGQCTPSPTPESDLFSQGFLHVQSIEAPPPLPPKHNPLPPPLPPKNKKPKPPVPPRNVSLSGASIPLSTTTRGLIQRVQPNTQAFLNTPEPSKTLPRLPSTTPQTPKSALKRSGSVKGAKTLTFDQWIEVDEILKKVEKFSLGQD